MVGSMFLLPRIVSSLLFVASLGCASFYPTVHRDEPGVARRLTKREEDVPVPVPKCNYNPLYGCNLGKRGYDESDAASVDLTPEKRYDSLDGLVALKRDDPFNGIGLSLGRRSDPWRLYWQERNRRRSSPDWVPSSRFRKHHPHNRILARKYIDANFNEIADTLANDMADFYMHEYRPHYS